MLIPVTSLQQRTSELQHLFAGIAGSKAVQVFFRSTVSRIIVGVGPDTHGRNLRDGRHPTRSRYVFLNYFEIWDAVGGARQYELDKAYLHLDVPRSDGTGDTEVLALHCDPRTSTDDGAYHYKRGPHMHLPLAMYSLSKSHVALCMQDTNIVCSNVDAFNQIMQKIVAMIESEFLGRIEGETS